MIDRSKILSHVYMLFSHVLLLLLIFFVSRDFVTDLFHTFI